MNNISGILILVFILISYSCSHSDQITQEGKYDEGERMFYSERIKWEVKVPEGWVITSIDTLKSQFRRGQDQLKIDEAKYAVDKTPSMQNLIGFKRDKRNSFTAFLEPYNYPKSQFDEYNRLRKKNLYEQLLGQGVSIDTSWMKTKVGEIDFHVFQVDVLNKDGDNFFSQQYYNTQFENQILTIIIGFDSQKTKEELLNCIMSSNFED
jgi:hypothetical protein